MLPTELFPQHIHVAPEKFLSPGPMHLVADACQIGKAFTHYQWPIENVDAPGIDQGKFELPIGRLADQNISARQIAEKNTSTMHGEEVVAQLLICICLSNIFE